MRNLLIEYVGGPKDGSRAYLLRTSPKERHTYPLEIRYLDVDPETKAERFIGTYTRDSESADGAMRYVWAYRGLHSHSKVESGV